REGIASSRERLARLAGGGGKAQGGGSHAHPVAAQAESDLMVRVALHSNALSGAESVQKMIEENARAVARINDRVAEALALARKAEEQHGGACVAEAEAREVLAAAEKVLGETGVLPSEQARGTA